MLVVRVSLWKGGFSNCSKFENLTSLMCVHCSFLLLLMFLFLTFCYLVAPGFKWAHGCIQMGQKPLVFKLFTWRDSGRTNIQHVKNLQWQITVNTAYGEVINGFFPSPESKSRCGFKHPPSFWFGFMFLLKLMSCSNHLFGNKTMQSWRSFSGWKRVSWGRLTRNVSFSPPLECYRWKVAHVRALLGQLAGSLGDNLGLRWFGVSAGVFQCDKLASCPGFISTFHCIWTILDWVSVQLDFPSMQFRVLCFGGRDWSVIV